MARTCKEECMVRGGLRRRLARYGGRPEPSALNVIVESLKLIVTHIIDVLRHGQRDGDQNHTYQYQQ